MEEFYQHTVDELVLSETFRQIILHPTQSQLLDFEQWVAAHPVEGRRLLAAADIIRAVQIEQVPLQASDQSEAVQQIFELTTRKKQPSKVRLLHYWPWAAAAVLAVLIGFYILPPSNNTGHIASRKSAQQTEREWVRNGTAHSQLIQLADGSTIFLKPGSAIRYPDHFEADARKVDLEGEAFFEIAPDHARPFYVQAGKTVTKVLGTSFSVRAFGKEMNTVVGVRTGKVQVSRITAGGTASATQIVPGQQATIPKNSGDITKSLLRPDDEISAFLRSAANGKNIEVAHYLNTARKAFDLNISFDPKKIKSCRIRANFEGMHVIEQIDAMCKAINASYSVENGGIRIQSKGC